MNAGTEQRGGARARLSDSAWLALLGGVLVVCKGAVWALDADPRFFLGDSGSYLATAAAGWVPPDRSFVYGLLIGVVCPPGKGLWPLIAAQSALGVLSALVLAWVLRRNFGCGRLAATTAALLVALDPLQLYYEHAVMTEAGALCCLSLLLWALAAQVARGSPASSAAAGAAGAALVLFRSSYLPVAAALLLFAPALWAVDGRRVVGTARALARAAVSVVVGGALFAGLLVGYVHGLASREHIAPQLSRSDGYFLLAHVAHLLEPADVADAGLRTIVFGRGGLPLQEREDMQQMFDPNGLCARLAAELGHERGNSAARKLAKLAIRKHARGFALLGATTLGHYFDAGHIRHSTYEALGRNRALELDLLQVLHDRFGLVLPASHPQRPAPLANLVEKTWPLHYLRLCIPLAIAAAAVLSWPRRRPSGSVLLMGAAIVFTLGSLSLGTIMDIRYLHPFSWFAALGVGLAAHAVGSRNPRLDAVRSATSRTA